MIFKFQQEDFKEIYEIINDAAIAFKVIIPEDICYEPYVPQVGLQKQNSVL